MATIKNLKEQERAIKDVNGLINKIKQANEFINTKYIGEEYKISSNIQPDQYDYPTTIETYLICENKKPVEGIVLNYKKSLVKKLNELIGKYNIALTTN